jgi:hypothetical protein
VIFLGILLPRASVQLYVNYPTCVDPDSCIPQIPYWYSRYESLYTATTTTLRESTLTRVSILYSIRSLDKGDNNNAELRPVLLCRL